MKTSLEPVVRRLWLVRHGETIWNREKRFFGHQDVALSRVGEAQAQWAGEQLHDRPIVAMYTSDLQRAHQTAKIIARHCSASLVINASPAWRELSFGDWEGLTYPQIVSGFPEQLDFFTDPMQAPPPHGESLAVLLHRVQMALAQLTQDALLLPDGDMVLVSHQGTLRVLVCCMLGLSLDHHWQLRFDHGSLSALDFLVGTEDVAATTTLSLLNQHASEVMLHL